MIRLFCLILFLFGAEARAGFQRIVCLNPLLSEWVAEILGRKAALQRVVGVSEYSNHPDYLRGVPEVGPYPKLHLEKIASLKPDLVLASEEYNLPEQVEQLKRLKLNVISVKKESFGLMEEWIDSLGKILGESGAGAEARNRWKGLRKTLGKNTGTKTRVFIEIQHRPLITVGGDSYLNDALESVGLKNVFSSVRAGYPKVSIESVLSADPERILILDHAEAPVELAESKKDWTRFQTLSAVRSGRIEMISGDDFARCSLRLLNALKGLRSRHEERNP